MRKIQPKRVITSQAKATTAAKYSMKNTQVFSYARCPAKKDISDDTEWLTAMVLVDKISENFLKGRFKRSGGLYKANDMAIGKDIGVLRVWREAMIGA